jgi:Flp pilus assembly protein TadG
MKKAQKQGQRPRRNRGAAAVEFALILPLLITLVFGVVQFGLLFNRQQALHASAREGARLAALPSSTQAEIETLALATLNGVPTATTPTVTIEPNVTRPCEGRLGETVVVTVSVPTTIEIPLWGSAAKTITGRGEFRCE